MTVRGVEKDQAVTAPTSTTECPTTFEDDGGVQSKMEGIIHEHLVHMEQDARRNEDLIRKQSNRNIFVLTNRFAVLRQSASRFPRIYYCFRDLLFPLLLLLAMAFAFGSAVAFFEFPGEIADNDALLAGTFDQYGTYLIDRVAIHKAIMEVPAYCLTQYDINFNLTEPESTADRKNLASALLQCAKGEADRSFPIDTFFPTFFDAASPELSFAWTTCSRMIVNESPGTFASDYNQQYTQYVTDFVIDLGNLLNASVGDPSNANESEFRYALSQATGSQSCRPHYVGGALFWFTVMTTIGYGSAVPDTEGGRALVYTCGFITIIGFIALNSTASSFVLTIVDDILLRQNLRPLTRGIPSVLLWLGLYVLAVLGLAASTVRWAEDRIKYTMPLGDAFWFSYVTTTTIGFGDTSIPPEEFTAGDMFAIPFIVLFGFVLLGNFATKLINCIAERFPADKTLESILAASRKQHLQATPQLLPDKPTVVLMRRHSL
jgi:hypothetical protein